MISGKTPFIRRTFSFLIVLTLLFGVFTAITPVIKAEEPSSPENVIYISNEGSGDKSGSSPENALGNDDGYANALSSALPGEFDGYTGNVLYRAFDALKENGGVIVLAGDVSIDSSEILGQEISELPLPQNNDNTVTVTSKLDGKDFGGRLILDKSKWNSVNLSLNGKTVWQDITLVSKTNPQRSTGEYADASFIFACNAYETLFGNGIVCTLDGENAQFPVIAGASTNKFSVGKESFDGNTSVTVKSGEWEQVCGGVFGSDAFPDMVFNGNVSLTLDGGKIKSVIGTCSDKTNIGKAKGDVSITVNGCEITRLCGTNAKGLDGTLSVTINSGSVTKAFDTCPGFDGENADVPSASELRFVKGTINDNRIDGFAKKGYVQTEEESAQKQQPEEEKTGIAKWWDDLKAEFTLNFIKGNRWKWLLNGLIKTLEITFFAVLLGIVVGVTIAIIRSTYDKNKEVLKKKKGIGYYVLKILNIICNIYLTVIRGTPVVVQLLIMYFIVFASSTQDTMVAIFAFGINSGAYVAEIFRGGIMSIDNGQFEAGRSLGFNYIQTMIYIVIPQMFKVVLPTLCNEFIVLLKETSVAGYVGTVDLTKAGDRIRGITFSAFMPLIAVALIYLLLVMLFTWLVGKLERRLRKSDH